MWSQCRNHRIQHSKWLAWSIGPQLKARYFISLVSFCSCALSKSLQLVVSMSVVHRQHHVTDKHLVCYWAVFFHCRQSCIEAHAQDYPTSPCRHNPPRHIHLPPVCGQHYLFSYMRSLWTRRASCRAVMARITCSTANQADSASSKEDDTELGWQNGANTQQIRPDPSSRDGLRWSIFRSSIRYSELGKFSEISFQHDLMLEKY